MSFNMQRSRSSHSVRSMHRPLSRASTTSAASPAPESFQQELQQYSQPQYMTSGPEAALIQYAGMQNGQHFDPSMQHALQSQQMQMGMEFQPRPYTLQDGQYMMHNPDYASSMHVPSAASINGLDADERRRKGSAATATNDKELRELLSRNEERGLKDVAQEVIQKERTPQAEKTKQLFAMLWCVHFVNKHVNNKTYHVLGYARFANRPRHLYLAIVFTRTMRRGVVLKELFPLIQLRLASWSESYSLAYKHADLVCVANPNTTM